VNQLDKLRRDASGNFQVLDRSLDMPVLPERFANAEPAIRFAAAAEQVDELGALTKQVESDQTLSELGKLQKLDPQRETLIRRIAGHIAELDKFEKSINTREAKLLEVPTLHREAAAEAAIDIEIRSWWRGLTVPERADLMKRMNDEPGHERVELALLRAPYGRVDLEIRSIRESWNQAKRMENPAEVVAIADDRAALAWAQRGFGHLIALTAGTTRFQAERVLAIIVKDEYTAPAAPLWGFEPAAIAHAKFKLEEAARRRSA
jgi:hypothetical protein